MKTKRKKPQIDLRNYYTLFLEAGLILVLLFATAVMKLEIKNNHEGLLFAEEQEVVEMTEIIRTEQIETPPPPQRPAVLAEVPNDEIIDDQILDLDTELDLDAPLEMPPPPAGNEEDEENFFIVVEEDPALIGGREQLQECVNYPLTMQRAGIEGRVTVQVIVNRQGRAEDPVVLRGVNEILDEEAVRCVREARFTPGRQMGEPVRVQYTVFVVFRLQ